MMRSLYSAVSGLQVHQSLMDVLSNNIANVNTPGFKKATVTFQDMLSQTLQGAQAGGIGIGGINAQQIGLGVQIGSINTTLTQGAAATTGRGTDLMINGEGYFILMDVGTNKYYTRAGVFSLDDNGDLVNAANGMHVCDDLGAAITGITGSSLGITSDGTITTTIEGVSTPGSKIGLATFPNAEGLKKVGENMYIETPATGAAEYTAPGTAGTSGRTPGTLTAGTLEMSNVDLAQEFVNMIIAERGFQANSKAIQTSDTMLDQLIQIKR
jgi:flagellar hook protein FlgE